jgi:hypothetical protein
MAEIKKTLAILKARWPEAAFIIGIPLLATLLRKILLNAGVKSTSIITSATLLVSLLFSLISMLLRLGFLRTIYLEGQKRQTLAALLRTGVHFLWRMFVLGLIYMMLLMLLMIVFSKLVPPEAISWVYMLYPILVNLILIKLMVLIPALIIVLDCKVFDSFRFLRRYKLSNAKELIFLYCGNIAFGFFGAILSRYFWRTSCGTACCSTTTTPQYILTTVFYTITYFISLMISVMAVRFVASHNSAHDDYGASLNSESLQEY